MDLGGCLWTEALLCEILKRLPVKSLVRFTSVSKPWSHLIKDPSFVTSHHQFNKSSSSSSSSVLGFTFKYHHQFEYFRIDHTDKTTLEHLKIPFLWRLKPGPKPQPRTLGPLISIRGHCNGLILAFDSQTFYVDEFTPEFTPRWARAKRIAFDVDRYIICNPIARRFFILPESTIEPPDLNLEEDFVDEYEYKKLNAIGFGFIDDVVYKVVRVTYGMALLSHDDIEGFKPYEPPWVEAYDSRSCYWRRVLINSEFSYEYLNDGVFNSFDGCLYWLGRGDGNRWRYSILVSFHLVDETWHETLFPYNSRYDDEDREDGAFGEYGVCQFVQIVGESVVLFVGDQRNSLLCNVWKMNKDDDNKVSWTHMCRLNSGGSPVGFIRDGEVLLMMNSSREEDPRKVLVGAERLWCRGDVLVGDWGKLAVYDSKKVNEACFGFTDLGFKVGNVVPNFVESLVLLDGESGFVEEESEETYYFSEEEKIEKPRKRDWEEDEDLGDFLSMFDDNLEHVSEEDEDLGDLQSMFDDNLELT